MILSSWATTVALVTGQCVPTPGKDGRYTIESDGIKAQVRRKGNMLDARMMLTTAGSSFPMVPLLQTSG